MTQVWRLLFPWTWAILLFNPVGRYEYDDPAIWLWSKVRGLLTAVVIVGVTLRFEPTGIAVLQEVVLFNILAATVWGAVVVLTVCPVIWLFVVVKWKGVAALALSKPVIRLGLFVAIIVGLIRVTVFGIRTAGSAMLPRRVRLWRAHSTVCCSGR